MLMMLVDSTAHLLQISIAMDYTSSVNSTSRPELCWIETGVLCCLTTPPTEDVQHTLVENNISHLVCVGGREDEKIDTVEGITRKEIILSNGHIPTLEDVVDFLTLVDLSRAHGKVVAIGGSEEHGENMAALLACWFVESEELSAHQALQKVCDLRPGAEVKRFQRELVSTFCKNRHRVPWRFSWVVKNRLCVMAFPDHPDNFQYLVDNNVHFLVCLTHERDPNIQNCPDLHKVDIKIPDFCCPTLEQVDQFLQVVDKAEQDNKAVAIHCAGGRGRTGTMASCLLVRDEGMTASQAIDHIRGCRPGSVETTDQEHFIHKFEKTLRSRNNNRTN